MPSLNSVICSRLFSSLKPSMPRPRYRITAADVRVVHRWVRERLRNDAWLEDWPRFTAWDKFPYEKPTIKTTATIGSSVATMGVSTAVGNWEMLAGMVNS